jgi:hypothetical protein
MKILDQMANINTSVNKIPIRATILSALSLLPYILIVAILSTSELKINDSGMGTHVVIQV